MSKTHKIMLGGAIAIIAGSALVQIGWQSMGIGMILLGFWTVVLAPFIADM